LPKSNILFIINPISGGKDKLKLPALIDALLDREKFNPNFSFTAYAGHAAEIAEEAATRNFDIIVAVGGDGTVNEVAAKVMKHDKILGIIPFGSGNGLARFLKIPMSVSKAIGVINSCDVQKIDTGLLNEKHFFNMAGIGFDAHISSVFAGNISRGLSGYLKLGLQEVFGYKAQTYHLNIDNVKYVRKAFLISIANSSQYGNNVHIAPTASVVDGLFDICIVKEFPLYKWTLLAYQMVTGKTDQSELVEIIKGKQILITMPQADPIHIDGEPITLSNELRIEIQPLSLKIIAPLT